MSLGPASGGADGVRPRRSVRALRGMPGDGVGVADRRARPAGARALGLGVALLGLAAAAPATAREWTWIQPGAVAHTACGDAPLGWQRPDFDDHTWSERGAVPDGGTCVGTQLARWRFDVGSERDALATVTVRLRYSHGFAAYLNGVELARRRLDPGAPPAALATETHGPEVESFVVPLRPGLLRPHNNVLAVEVHPHTNGYPSFYEVALAGADGPRLVRGPYLLDARGHAAVIVLDTDLPTTAEVRWGRSSAYGARVRDDVAATHHVLRLSGLEPGAVYHYRARAFAAKTPGRTMPAHAASDARAAAVAAGATVAAESAGHNAEGDDASGPADDASPGGDVIDAGDASFHLPPAAGRPLRFAVYGDVRSGHDIHAQLNQTLAAEEPDFAILTGDLVDRGSDEGDWERFFAIAGPLLRGLCIFPALGNHEYARMGKGLAAFLQLFRWPLGPADQQASWYSFDVAGVHFVALDSTQYQAPRQLAWLERDLAAATAHRPRAIFVYAHQGPYSSGLHGDSAICQRLYVPLLERYHVTMFFGGHDHDYERGHVGGLDYVVTGGGGAELRAQRCGVPGRKPCPPRVAAFANEHNYVMVELLPAFFRVCPKRVDGTPLEACTTYRLK